MDGEEVNHKVAKFSTIFTERNSLITDFYIQTLIPHTQNLNFLSPVVVGWEEDRHIDQTIYYHKHLILFESW